MPDASELIAASRASRIRGMREVHLLGAGDRIMCAISSGSLIDQDLPSGTQEWERVL